MSQDTNERSPLLSSPQAGRSNEESEPLLSQEAEHNDGSDTGDEPSQNRWFSWWHRWWSSSTLKNLGDGEDSSAPPSKRRWASITAMLVMGSLIVLVIVLGFVVPPAIQSYVEKALVLEPTDLTLESLKAEGARARIRANFRLDGTRVHDANSRRLGRFVTGVMRKLATKETQVEVFLPDFDNAILGVAVIPPLVVDIRDGQTNEMDFVADLNSGEAEDIRTVVNTWLDGKLDHLKLTGTASVRLESGLFPLGTHDVKESMVFEAKQIPTVPEYEIRNLTFYDVPVEDSSKEVVGSELVVTAFNKYPISADVPPLAFQVLVQNCDPSEPKILVAEALTSPVQIRSSQNVTVKAKGVVDKIPESLTRSCPSNSLSPLDDFVQHYLRGESVTLYVRGKEDQPSGTPDWIRDILRSTTIPFEYQSNPFGDFIRNFSLADVDFQLPNPFSDPKSPDSQPRVSGVVEVLGALPSGFKVNLGVDGVKATADLFYTDKKMGELNLDQWQDANSTRVDGSIDEEDMLNITSRIVNAPLDITDADVFGELLREMLFGNEELELDIESMVDVKVSTVIGPVTLRGIPAQGKIPVKRPPGNIFKALQLHVTDIKVLNTWETGVALEAILDIENPTPYTANVPYVNIHVVHDGEIIGEAVGEDIDLHLGNNTGLVIQVTWDPIRFGGDKDKAQEIGKQLLSDYVSGKNVTLTVQAHRDTIPSMPRLGEALSNITFEIPAPHIKLPGDDGEDGESVHFIRSADFHIFSSVTTFLLASPLRHDTLYIAEINATAFYNHTEPIGRIIHAGAFPVTPGLSTTPRLPVEWSASSIGYDKLKDALGGTLKLDAVADVRVKMGNWEQEIKYQGTGIGAHVHI